MKLSKLIRSSEWWGYKVPTVLCIAYATTIDNGRSCLDLIATYFFLIVSLSVMGAYASFINDYTDMEIDKACGKSNLMEKVPPNLRPALIALPFFFIILFSYIIYPDKISLFFYLMIGISISLYSFPPFRLKDKGIWGVLSCAMAEQMFPSLFCASMVFFKLHQPINISLILSITCFSLLFGIRCILWHQFLDRQNDINSGINTFATKIIPSGFKTTERIVAILETLALLSFLILLQKALPLLSIFLYFLLVYFRYKRYSIGLFIIVAPQKEYYQMLWSDYYQVFLPWSLLISSAIIYPYSLVVFIVHLLLFPGQTISILREFYLLLRAVLSKLVRHSPK